MTRKHAGKWKHICSFHFIYANILHHNTLQLLKHVSDPGGQPREHIPGVDPLIPEECGNLGTLLVAAEAIKVLFVLFLLHAPHHIQDVTFKHCPLQSVHNTQADGAVPGHVAVGKWLV